MSPCSWTGQYEIVGHRVRIGEEYARARVEDGKINKKKKTVRAALGSLLLCDTSVGAWARPRMEPTRVPRSPALRLVFLIATLALTLAGKNKQKTKVQKKEQKKTSRFRHTRVRKSWELYESAKPSVHNFTRFCAFYLLQDNFKAIFIEFISVCAVFIQKYLGFNVLFVF